MKYFSPPRRGGIHLQGKSNPPYRVNFEVEGKQNLYPNFYANRCCLEKLYSIVIFYLQWIISTSNIYIWISNEFEFHLFQEYLVYFRYVHVCDAVKWQQLRNGTNCDLTIAPSGQVFWFQNNLEINPNLLETFIRSTNETCVILK